MSVFLMPGTPRRMSWISCHLNHVRTCKVGIALFYPDSRWETDVQNILIMIAKSHGYTCVGVRVQTPCVTPKTAGVATGPESHTCRQITITAKEAPGKYISQL